MTTTINGVTVTAPEGMDYEEQLAYVERQKAKHPGLKALEITLDGDFVGLKSITPGIPFNRIRRITGYLVGGMERWNNAKYAEERDRVKHNV